LRFTLIASINAAIFSISSNIKLTAKTKSLAIREAGFSFV
jgi:hypothetical protein